MKLLLDEHYPKEIAEQLRKHGHEVDSVQERAELLSLADPDLLLLMSEERRAIMTEDVADFMPLIREALAAERDHYGLVITSPRRFQRRRENIGLFVRSLEWFLRSRPAEDALLNQVHWLEPASR